MESKYKNIQVYSIWVNGRGINDINQHFPILDCGIDTHIWHSDLKRAVKEYFKASVKDDSCEYGLYSEIYKDFHVCLNSIDIDIDKFKSMFNLDFNIDEGIVQELIPYYVDYNLNIVAERVCKFKK